MAHPTSFYKSSKGQNWGQMFREEASLVPGKTGGLAEVFEFCPYGAPVSQEEFQRLFEG